MLKVYNLPPDGVPKYVSHRGHLSFKPSRGVWQMNNLCTRVPLSPHSFLSTLWRIYWLCLVEADSSSKCLQFLTVSEYCPHLHVGVCFRKCISVLVYHHFQLSPLKHLGETSESVGLLEGTLLFQRSILIGKLVWVYNYALWVNDMLDKRMRLCQTPEWFGRVCNPQNASSSTPTQSLCLGVSSNQNTHCGSMCVLSQMLNHW